MMNTLAPIEHLKYIVYPPQHFHTSDLTGAQYKYVLPLYRRGLPTIIF